MNMEVIKSYQKDIEHDLSFKEISKLYREILYKKYEEVEGYQKVHCYQLLRDMIDIFTQIVEGREFEEEYLKDKIKW